MVAQFAHTFTFVDEQTKAYATLQVIKEKIFTEVPIEGASFDQCNMPSSNGWLVTIWSENQMMTQLI